MAVSFSLPLPPAPTSERLPRFTSPVSFFGYAVFRIYLLAFLLFTLPSNTNGANPSTCVTSYDPAKDYFPEKITVTEAEDFSVTYFKNYKLVNNERTGEVFALYQCGTPAPTGLNATVKVFPIPLQTVAITSTVDIPFIEMLGMRTRIKLVQGPEYVSSPCLQSMIVAGTATSLSNNDSVADIQLADVDAVFVFSAEPSMPKAISVSTVLDPGAVHRAEWIDYFSLFFNAEDRSNVIFGNLTARYDCVSAIARAATATQPKVAWVDFRSYQAKKWAISNRSFKLEFIKDLGALPISYDFENFDSAADWQAHMADVDIVIDETYMGTMAAFYTNFNLTSTSNFKFIRNGQVWRVDKLQSALGAMDWFEGALMNPDAVLEDLFTIVKPQASFPHTRIWLRNSFNAEPIVVEDAAKCPDPTVVPVPRATQCVLPEDDSAASFLRPAALATLLLAAILALILA